MNDSSTPSSGEPASLPEDATLASSSPGPASASSVSEPAVSSTAPSSTTTQSSKAAKTTSRGFTTSFLMTALALVIVLLAFSAGLLIGNHTGKNHVHSGRNQNQHSHVYRYNGSFSNPGLKIHSRVKNTPSSGSKTKSSIPLCPSSLATPSYGEVLPTAPATPKGVTVCSTVK